MIMENFKSNSDYEIVFSYLRRALFIVCLFLLNHSIDAQTIDSPKLKYQLIWQDEFTGTGQPDPGKWVFSKWNPMCTDNNFLAFVKDGSLILRAMKNPDQSDKVKKYIAGCVETKGKQEFRYGVIKVRAKFSSAIGSWPAIWLKPIDPSIHKGWPTCGEIDMMEHLNKDPFVHVSIHSYNRKNKIKSAPAYHEAAEIKPNEFNIYGMVWKEDSICLYVNDVLKFTYPKIAKMGEKQWPYDVPFFLLLNQIVGGWAGKINDNELPVQMEVDWVRFYTPEEK
jgi:beta-glucanase (GH16 family)